MYILMQENIVCNLKFEQHVPFLDLMSRCRVQENRIWNLEGYHNEMWVETSHNNRMSKKRGVCGIYVYVCVRVICTECP